MNEGSITFSTALDNEEMEKELNSLTRKIDKLEDKINQKQAERMPLVDQAQQLGAELDAAKAKLYEMQSAAAGAFSSEEIKDQKIHVAGLQAEWNSVQGRVERYDTAISNATIELDRSKEKAGTVASELAATGSNSKAMGDALKKASKRLDTFKSRLAAVVRSALVFTVITQALAKFRDWFKNVIKVSPQAAAAVAKLKAALLTMMQPLVNVIIPAFTALVDVLTNIVTKIAEVVAALSGMTAEEAAAAAEALNDETSALDDTSAAAKKAAKSLANFDEINKLSENDASADSDIDPNFKGLFDGVKSKLELTMDDILFKWKDLTGEQILEKIVIGLTALCVGIIGFAVGGVGEAALGITIGAAAGILISKLLFNGDGKLSNEEIIESIIFALTTIAGSIIGFKAGKSTGAAIGVTVGASITLAISKLLFNGDGKLSNEEIISLVITALTAIAGLILGFKIGKSTGAAIGITVGASIGLAISKLLFNGDGKLSNEEIIESIIFALTTIAGGVLGFVAEGPGGAAIGVIVGASMGLAISKLLFNGDGKLSSKEIANLIVTVLSAIAGGVIGFSLGGPGGALLGIAVGASISLMLEKLSFVPDEYKDITTTIKASLATLSAGILILGKVGFATAFAAAAFVLLAGGIATLADHWDEMSGAQRAITILGSLAAAALAAAVAIAVFHTAWTVGIAAAAIAAGLALLGITYAFTSGRNASSQMIDGAYSSASSFYSSQNFNQTLDLPSIPALATGAVIPPNQKFLAMLGDQKSGNNIEAPEDLIRKIVREESGGDTTVNNVMTLDGEVVYRNQNKISRRHGTSLVERKT